MKDRNMSLNLTHVLTSFVVRNPDLSHEEFSKHYEFHHGPLAAGLSGFRMYVSRYVQNHVIEKLSGSIDAIDGVTILSQIPREDQTKGFFQHPEFAAHVQSDSKFLFDIPKNRAFLGIQHTRKSRFGSHKLLLLTSDQSADLVITLLSADEFQVTDFGDTTDTSVPAFGYGRMIEAWFDSLDSLRAGLQVAMQTVDEPIDAWSVREVLIYDGVTAASAS
jgi:hypothetical protein